MTMNPIRRMDWKMVAFALLFVFGFSTYSNAQQFERFFTTAKERKHLQELRRQKPERNTPPAAPAVVEELFVGDASARQAEAVPLDIITVKGLVYRKNKNATAWINDSNTFEGDPAMAYLNVDENKISHKEVTVTLPAGEKNFKLKVGQSYDIQNERVIDVIVDSVIGERGFSE